jgi:hypothetical protein
VRAEASEDGVHVRPVVRGIVWLGGVARLRRGDRPPVDHVAHELRAELVERRKVRFQRRARREVGIVLDPEANRGGGGGRRRQEGRDGRRSERGEECELQCLGIEAMRQEVVGKGLVRIPGAFPGRSWP